MPRLSEYLQEQNIDALQTEDGLYYHIDNSGKAPHPQPGDYVKVHYTGRLLDGKKFDSSHDRGQPLMFQLGVGRVIKGWDLGIPLFGVGGKGTLFLPSELGYGERGAGAAIPPHADLIFEVELLEVLDEAAYRREQVQQEALQRELLLKQVMLQLEADKKLIEAYAVRNNLPIERTATGLAYVVEKQGEGPRAAKGNVVSVHYTGTLLDGTVFDSSYSRGEPIRFTLGQRQVIPAWDEGLAYFRAGGKGKLIAPSPLAYGPKSIGPIPPNSVLVFEVELVKIEA